MIAFSFILLLVFDTDCKKISVAGMASDYAIGNAIYVGPWLPSISNTIDIEVTPVTGSDISIILAEDTVPTAATAYQIGESKYYCNILVIRKARHSTYRVTLSQL